MKFNNMWSGRYPASAFILILLTASFIIAGVILSPVSAHVQQDSITVQQPKNKKDGKNSIKGNGSSGVTKTLQESPEKETVLDTSKINPVQIDTSKILNRIDTSKTIIKVDSITTAVKENTLTNTKLFVYIIISIGGLGLFYFIFVRTLFKSFHKTRSTRQSLMLSWDLFFIVSVVWIFIVWGVVAGMWSSASFMTVLIFLFIISLILSLIAVKSK